MADLLNLFNSAANLSNTITSDIIRKQEENAALKVKTTMQDYAIKQQEFLRDLQSNPEKNFDFENWGKYATDFQEEYKKSIFSNKANPVNKLTAKYLNESLDAQYTSLLLKVRDQAYKNIDKDNYIEAMKSVSQTRTLKTGQEGYDEELSVYNDLYSKGLMSLEDFYKNQSEANQYHTYKNMQKSVLNTAQEAIASGKSLEECLRDATKNIKQYTNIKISNTDQPLTGDELKQMEGEIRNQVEKEYNSGLSNLQKNNETYLSQYESAINHDPVNKEVYKRQGMNYLDALMKNNKNNLSIAQRTKYERLFRPDIDEETEGNGARASAKSINFDTQMNNTAKSLINAVKFGEFNSNVQGLSSGHEVMAYYNSIVTETLNSSNLSEVEKQEKYISYNRDFMEQLKSAYKKDCPFVGEMIDKLNSKIDQWNKNGKYNSKELTNQALEFLLDQVADLDPSNKAQMEQALKNTESYMQTFFSNDVADWMKGKTESDKFISKWTNKDGTLKPESLAAGMYELQLVKEKKKNPNAKIIYSNFYGEIDLSQSATDAINRVIDPGAKNAIAMITGGNAENISAEWESDGLFKETGNRIYQDKDGNLYKIISTGKDTYDIMKKNGKDFEKIANSKDVKKTLKASDEQKKINDENKAKTNAAKKEKLKAQNEVKENQKMFVTEKLKEMAQSDKSPLLHLSDTDWNLMDEDQRVDELRRNNDIVSNILNSNK